MEAPELKPCPFCGGKPNLSKSYNEHDEGAYFSYRCKSCGASTRELYARETCPVFYGQVRDVWNDRRGIAAQLQEARDEAREDVLAYFTALEAIELNAFQLAIQQGLSGVVHSNRANKAAFAIAALETLKSTNTEGEG